MRSSDGALVAAGPLTHRPSSRCVCRHQCYEPPQRLPTPALAFVVAVSRFVEMVYKKNQLPIDPYGKILVLSKNSAGCEASGVVATTVTAVLTRRNGRALQHPGSTTCLCEKVKVPRRWKEPDERREMCQKSCLVPYSTKRTRSHQPIPKCHLACMVLQIRAVVAPGRPHGL